MPHTSAIGMPIPAKKASVSLGIGAAPDTAHRSWSSPNLARSWDSTSSSAFSDRRLLHLKVARRKPVPGTFPGNRHSPLQSLALGLVLLVGDGEFIAA